jgi:hypothetical protein
MIKLGKAYQVATLAAAVTIEQVFERVDIERGAGLGMQGTEPDELGASSSGASAPVVPLQVLQQRHALFEPF